MIHLLCDTARPGGAGLCQVSLCLPPPPLRCVFNVHEVKPQRREHRVNVSGGITVTVFSGHSRPDVPGRPVVRLVDILSFCDTEFPVGFCVSAESFLNKATPCKMFSWIMRHAGTVRTFFNNPHRSYYQQDGGFSATHLIYHRWYLVSSLWNTNIRTAKDEEEWASLKCYRGT